MDFPKKQQQCLIPKYLLDYLGEVNELHPDPSDLGGGDNIEAGTGIDITGDDVKTISVDSSVAMKTDIPDVSDFITENEVDTKLEDYELKADAFSGSYNDLTNKPDLSVYELKSEAFSGNYNDLTNKPTIPTKTSDLNNDSGFITNSVNNLTNYYDKTSIDGLVEDIDEDIALKANAADLASVATTGDYDDLIDKPDLSVYALSSSLASVATTGNYNDLSNKPTIPTVNNSTITITQGGVSKGTFTLNQSSDSTIALDAGGGGSSYTAGTGIDITNDVISVDSTVAMKTDIPSLTNYVTTNTDQNITGVKTFVGAKRIAFKMSSSSDKLGFTCYDNNNKEIGYLESRIKSSVPQMSIGMYNTTSSSYDRKLQLSYQSNNGGTTYNYNIVCPTRLQKNGSDVFMPVSVNGTEADNTGNITLSIPTVVDTVADGNMNAVTSNAVYDIVGDIETLLAAL